MVANEFAAFVRRNNRRMVDVLVHAVLEWTLISLLLLDSVLSYLSYRFASCFGLKTPCLFCSRLEDRFHLDRGRGSYRELLCSDHAAELSLLGYCSVHRKLAETASMCRECSPSRPSTALPYRATATAPLSMVKREEGGKGMDCSCCQVRFESGFYTVDLLLKPSSRVNTQTGDSIQEKGMLEDGIAHGLRGIQIERGCDLPSPPPPPPPPPTGCRISGQSKDVEVNPYLDFIATFGDYEIAPTEIEHRAVSALTLAGKSDENLSKQHTHVKEEQQRTNANPKLKSTVAVVVEKQQVQMQEITFEATLGSGICATEQIDHPQLPQLTAPVDVHAKICDKTESKDAEEIDKKDRDDASEISEETGKCDQKNFYDDENESFTSLSTFEAFGITDHADAFKVSVRSEICQQKQIGDERLLSSGNTDSFIVHNESDFRIQASVHDTKTDLDTSCKTTVWNEMCNETQIDQYQPRTTAPHLGEVNVSANERLVAMDHGRNHQLSTSPRHSETGEERAPETPNSFKNFPNLCKTYLFCRKESGTESMDGNIACELDISEVSTVDQLKSALKDERRALNALYAELEEERSASAIAANQTMAMITRLQQEKAAMQMEALQYQRMMEERSEYDQKALHLLNDLVTKKEKEKWELEKDLEIYRNRVYLYKAKETRMNSSNTNGRSCTSPALSSAGDNDGLSVDDHNEGEEHSYGPTERNNATVDGIVSPGAHNEHTKHLNALDECISFKILLPSAEAFKRLKI